jgi:hypothetical protein
LLLLTSEISACNHKEIDVYEADERGIAKCKLIYKDSAVGTSRMTTQSVGWRYGNTMFFTT